MKFIYLTPTALFFLQFGALAVGMASWLDDDEGSEDSSDGGEFEMDDDFDDEFGSFDDMDDGGGAGGDSSMNELEHRIEELETEVSNVSSKANTVRSENEQISESVEDVEENVRKLLEIYEMVTRGVNPFVDDVERDSMGGGADGQDFGLFDEEGEPEEADEDLDSDIADADADDFFEDDAFEEFEDGDADDELEDREESDADEEMDGFDELEDGEDADDGGGTSFEELKEEYESGDADWTEGEEPEDDGGNEETPDLGFDDSDLEEGESEATAVEAGFEFGSEPGDADVDESADSAPGLGLQTRNDGPHLEEHPDGYLADVVSLEWLNHLLSEFGPKNTVRTLNYYERIGWIGEPAREQLFEHLEGLTDSDYIYRDEFGTTELTMDDHLESLDYIEELASEDIERAIVDRCEDLHRDGIQR